MIAGAGNIDSLPSFLTFKYYWLIKWCIALSSLAFICLAPPLVIVVAFVVFGQGHFALSYYYQGRAGKINLLYLLSFAAIFAGLTLSFIGQGRFGLLLTITVALSMIHFLLDEVKIASKDMDISRLFEILPPIVLSVAFIVSRIYEPRAIDFAAALTLACWVGRLLYFAIRGIRPDMLSGYLLVWGAVLFGLYLAGINPRPVQLFGFVALMHYADWYIHYARRVYRDPIKRKHYFRAVGIANALIIGIYLVTVSPPPIMPAPRSNPLFSIDYFYLWTIMHVLFSIRLSDYKRLAARPA